MDINFGTFIAVAAALFFYLRLIILQRQKVKSFSGKPVRSPGKSSHTFQKEGKGPSKDSIPLLTYKYPLLLIIGILLVIAGAILSAAGWFPSNIRPFWWIPVTVGILLMTVAIN